MKRIKIYLLMLLAALTVGSCGSDNDGPGGGIVNTNMPKSVWSFQELVTMLSTIHLALSLSPCNKVV
ncbi:unknown [Prevotella sp. CAG:604]|nr:unknown [Prevotella sp. CAG:604]